MSLLSFVRDVFDTPGPDDGAERYDTSQPWICWRFLHTDARTRITGRAVVVMDCCVCGRKRKIRGRVPRFGPVPDRGEHPERIRFKLDHLHPEKGHPMSWAKPLRNPFGQEQGLDINLLAMRLEADLRATTGEDIPEPCGHHHNPLGKRPDNDPPYRCLLPKGHRGAHINGSRTWLDYRATGEAEAE